MSIGMPEPPEHLEWHAASRIVGLQLRVSPVLLGRLFVMLRERFGHRSRAALDEPTVPTAHDGRRDPANASRPEPLVTVQAPTEHACLLAAAHCAFLDRL